MSEKEKTGITGLEKAGEDLFTFAFDGQDIRILMESLPEQAGVVRNTVEYELRILKIVSVGWSLSYYVEDRFLKAELTEIFWKRVHDFSVNISRTTGRMIGQEIDYFRILKEKLDGYVTALGNHPKAPEPAVVIGPAFAANCGNESDVYAVMTGSRMFLSTLARVKTYLTDLEATQAGRTEFPI